MERQRDEGAITIAERPNYVGGRCATCNVPVPFPADYCPAHVPAAQRVIRPQPVADMRDASTWMPPGCEPVVREELHPEIPPPSLAVDLGGFVSDLTDCGYPLAARCVNNGHREYAELLSADIRGGDRGPHALAEQMLVWGRGGRDAAVVASSEAWGAANGCEACAVEALATGDATTRCAECRERSAPDLLDPEGSQKGGA